MESIAKTANWLIPEEISPCDIFIQFRGQFALGVAAGKPISYDFLNKLTKAQYFQIYIRKKDETLWAAWAAKRHPAEELEKAEKENTELFGNKRAEYLSYVEKIFVIKDTDDPNFKEAFERANALVRKIIKLPTLEWFFQQFHDPPHLLYHSGRIAFPLAVFCFLHNLIPENELEKLVYSAIIHEIEGDPAESNKKIASEETIRSLEKRGVPVPKEIVSLIRFQDELCSGQGFPNKKTRDEIPFGIRIFSLFNHFDHARLNFHGTRRSRLEATKRKLENRKIDFEQEIWAKFWSLWEIQMENFS